MPWFSFGISRLAEESTLKQTSHIKKIKKQKPKTENQKQIGIKIKVYVYGVNRSTHFLHSMCVYIY